MQGRSAGILSCVFILIACRPPDDPPTSPQAYRDPVDRQIAGTGHGQPGRSIPCERDRNKSGLDGPMFELADQCVKMDPPRRWRGVWRNDFEGSEFCTAPASACPYDTDRDRIWLDSGSTVAEEGARYDIQFIGRKTMYRGAYGHMGMSAHKIIVDKVISIKMIEPPPKPPTKAEQDAWFAQCKKAGSCFDLNDFKK